RVHASISHPPSSTLLETPPGSDAPSPLAWQSPCSPTKSSPSRFLSGVVIPSEHCASRIAKRKRSRRTSALPGPCFSLFVIPSEDFASPREAKPQSRDLGLPSPNYDRAGSRRLGLFSQHRQPSHPPHLIHRQHSRL